MSRRPARSTRLAVGLGLAAVVLVAGCGGDGDDPAQAGDLVRGRLGGVDGTSHTLLLPNGLLTVVVADGASSIGPTEAADGTEHPAPDGTEWVALDWSFDPGRGIEPWQRALMEDKAQRTTLDLVAGDVTTDLGDAPGSTSTPAEVRTGGTVYVAVDTEDAAVIEVTFDGATTHIDTGTGEVSGDRADAITDLTAPVFDDCPPLRGSGAQAEITCSYIITTIPYLAGSGWSDDGWTVAQVETRGDTFVRGRGTYAVQSTEDDSGFDGETGTSEVADELLNRLITRVVTEGDAEQLDIVRRLTGFLTDGTGPEDATVELGATVDLG